MTGRISRKDAPSIRTIKDQMAGRLPDHSSAGRFEIFFERQVFAKRQMTWCRKGRKNGIGGHQKKES
jgi:tRNA A37 N6-isopentenylltransferase MiaA